MDPRRGLDKFLIYFFVLAAIAVTLGIVLTPTFLADEKGDSADEAAQAAYLSDLSGKYEERTVTIISVEKVTGEEKDAGLFTYTPTLIRLTDTDGNTYTCPAQGKALARSFNVAPGSEISLRTDGETFYPAGVTVTKAPEIDPSAATAEELKKQNKKLDGIYVLLFILASCAVGGIIYSQAKTNG